MTGSVKGALLPHALIPAVSASAASALSKGHSRIARMMGWILFGLSLALTTSLSALELQLPGIFSDQMVLQRDQGVPVWGTADPGASVDVTFAGQKKRTVAGTDGSWRVDLDPMDASADARVLTVTAVHDDESTSVECQDVLVGEVWLAGGQSNMYWRFRQLMQSPRDPSHEPVVEYLREEVERANDPLLRQYTVGRAYSILEPQSVGRGKWTKAIPGDINEFSGTGYFFARELRRELGVPVAIISCNIGGTRVEPWIAPAGFDQTPELKKDYVHMLATYDKQIDAWDDAYERDKYKKAMEAWQQAEAEGKKASGKPRKPEHPANNKQAYGSLYNAMVHPLIPYAIRGVIWYQGESNTGNYPDEYDLRLGALIKSWRAAWGQGPFSFYWCQLANYKEVNAAPVGDDDPWAVVQDRQRRALRIPKTGMAVLNDIGEAKDVHPRNKIDAGKRLSLWALKNDYGKDLVCSGPLYREAKRDGSKVVITFDQVGSGLMVGRKHLMEPTVEVDEPLQRFQICGSDGQWKWADAKITGKDTVTVWHDDVTRPVEVRYAWSSNPEGANLYNEAGLPASVFKTDTL